MTSIVDSLYKKLGGLGFVGALPERIYNHLGVMGYVGGISDRLGAYGGYLKYVVDMGAPLFAMLKYMASSESYVNNGATDLRTSAFKLALDGEFSAVRISVYARQAAGGFVAAVAPTETMDNSNDDNRYKPVSGGVVDDSLWSGGNVLPDVTTGSDARPAITKTDWIPLDSLPRVDGGDGGAILIRVSGVTSGSYQKISVNDDWQGAAGQPYFKEIYSDTDEGDTATDPTLSSPSGAYGESWSHWIGIEYQPKVSTKTIYAMGDSITSGGGGQLYGYDCWATRAAFQLSTASNPVSVVNGGMSGKSSASYVQHFFDMIDSGAIPTHVLIPAFTPNDGYANKANCDARIARIESVITKAKDINAHVYLWTGLPVDGYGTDEWIVYSNNYAISRASSDPYVTLVDFNSVVSDGATPMRFKSGYTEDGIHPSDVAIQAMADYLEGFI